MKKMQALMVMGMMLLATAALAFALGGGGGRDQVAASTKGRRLLQRSP